MMPRCVAAASTLALTLVTLAPTRSLAQAVPDDRVHVRVESAQSGLRLYYAHEGIDGRALCGAPCELTLRPGLHDFAVGTDRGSRMPVPIMALEADSVLHLEYQSHDVGRALGGLLSGLGIVIGLLGSISGVAGLAFGDGLADALGAAFLGGGAAVLILGVVGAVAFGSWGDSARMTVRARRSTGGSPTRGRDRTDDAHRTRVRVPL